MQSTITRVNSYTLSINIKESGAELEKAKKQIIETIRKKGKIKGFRPGSSIPDYIVIREYGEENIEQEAIDEVIGKIYPKILRKENIFPVAPGTITEIKSRYPLELTLEIEVLPDIIIDEKKMDTIRIKKTTVTVDESEIDKEIEAIKKRFTRYDAQNEEKRNIDDENQSPSTIETLDRATISAQGYDKKGGTAIPETLVKSYPLIIGSGSFIPGFEEKLIGARVGDEVSFDITFPKDYHSQKFRGQKIYFIVSIEKIEKPHIPEFDEDFIEKLRGKRTDMRGLREILRSEIQSKKAYEARIGDEDILMRKLLEISSFEIGPTLLKKEVDQVYDEHKERLVQQGYNIKEYLEHLRKSEEVYKDEVVKPEAERRLRAELLLRKIRELKGIDPTESEIQEEVEKIISQYGSKEVIERLRAKLIPGDVYYEDIRDRLAYRKIVDGFFFEEGS